MNHYQSIQFFRSRGVFRAPLALSVLLGMGALVHGLASPALPACTQDQRAAAPDDGRGTPYKVEKSDNLCGLSEPRQLSKPAKVDYAALLQATDEYREMRDKKIDPKSARGVELHNKAHNRIVAACERARVNAGYCSVWKTIARRDGKAIHDLTKAVKRDLAVGA
ncbi:MAG TPA: hypothetical protein EYQ25_11250 [Planctomycetes bacterium]|nr:hypothetical protein [Planctomycetota bacterium]HIL35969.1 hypothetical protein [Planctomycetota bacterium]